MELRDTGANRTEGAKALRQKCGSHSPGCYFYEHTGAGSGENIEGSGPQLSSFPDAAASSWTLLKSLCELVARLNGSVRRDDDSLAP